MKANQMLMKAAVAGLMGVAMSATSVLASDKGTCKGGNACKGKSACKTAENDCKGHNACKGKGWTEVTKAECDKHKGATWEAAAPAAHK